MATQIPQVSTNLVVGAGVLRSAEGGRAAERVEGDVGRAEVTVAEDDGWTVPARHEDGLQLVELLLDGLLRRQLLLHPLLVPESAGRQLY